MARCQHSLPISCPTGNMACQLNGHLVTLVANFLASCKHGLPIHCHMLNPFFYSHGQLGTLLANCMAIWLLSLPISWRSCYAALQFYGQMLTRLDNRIVIWLANFMAIWATWKLKLSQFYSLSWLQFSNHANRDWSVPELSCKVANFGQANTWASQKLCRPFLAFWSDNKH